MTLDLLGQAALIPTALLAGIGFRVGALLVDAVVAAVRHIAER